MTEADRVEMAQVVAETTDPELLDRLAQKAQELAEAGDGRGELLGRLLRWHDPEADVFDRPGFLLVMAGYEEAAEL